MSVLWLTGFHYCHTNDVQDVGWSLGCIPFNPEWPLPVVVCEWFYSGKSNIVVDWK